MQLIVLATVLAEIFLNRNLRGMSSPAQAALAVIVSVAALWIGIQFAEDTESAGDYTFRSGAAWLYHP